MAREERTDHIEESPALGAMIGFFLRNKPIVALLVVLVVGWGLIVAPFDWDLGGLPRDPVPVDAIPDIGENQQIVFTEWMGRSPQDVEDQITYPLTVSLLGMPGVRTVRSYSFFGFSSIYVIFERRGRLLLVAEPRPREARQPAPGHAARRGQADARPGRHRPRAGLLVHARGPRRRRQSDRRLGPAGAALDPGLVRALRADVRRGRVRGRFHRRLRARVPDRRRSRRACARTG